MTTPTPTRRGTSNKNLRGSSYTRRARRAWIFTTFASNEPGFVRCYRCGVLLYNPDTLIMPDPGSGVMSRPDGTTEKMFSLTIDRIVPGCQGGTYARGNIRPACGTCNSETGGSTRG